MAGNSELGTFVTRALEMECASYALSFHPSFNSVICILPVLVFVSLCLWAQEETSLNSRKLKEYYPSCRGIREQKSK